MGKVYNFAAGPSKIPEEVLVKAQHELTNYGESGVSVMELSHRSAEFEEIINNAELNLRNLLSLSQNYSVLFLQGGGNGQFACVPLNLVSDSTEVAVYLQTGSWSSKAVTEAKKYLQVETIKPQTGVYDSVPDDSYVQQRINEIEKETGKKINYLYYCANETIDGIEYTYVPELKHLDGTEVTLVCDMSSNFLTRQYDYSKFGLVFAGCQKNAGIAGLTIVLVRNDILARKQHPYTPSILDYKIMAKNKSLYNTPPCFSVYISQLCFQWILERGGLNGMDQVSSAKSKLVYDIIDNSGGFYSSKVQQNSRSRVNIPFRVGNGDPELEKKFLAEAKQLNMIQLKGHRSVGGIRVSLYNAITLPEAQYFAQFMKDFANKHAESN